MKTKLSVIAIAGLIFSQSSMAGMFGTSLRAIRETLRKEGLAENAQLIVAYDFTGSNHDIYSGVSLHSSDPAMHKSGPFLASPYSITTHAIGETLFSLDSNHSIDLLAFGDEQTRGVSVRSFGREISSVEQAVGAYEAEAASVVLSGPTNFGPAIRYAIQKYQETLSHQILVIITDGNVEGAIRNAHGQAMTCDEDTDRAIIEASRLPISIIGVGVGSSNFSDMRRFDHMASHGAQVDNFQFVKFKDYLVTPLFGKARFDHESFARDALKEIPKQIKQMKKSGIMR